MLSQVQRFFQQSRDKLNMDEISFDIVAKNGNNVGATFDFVEATFDFVERIVGLVASLDSVASTLFLVWTGV